MGFIEDIFRKKPEGISEKDVEDFVSRKIEEHTSLDYKNIRAFGDFEELSKDVSALANSAGGLMVLGISEDRIKENKEAIKIFPKEITWGDKHLSKEKLEDNLIGKIRPKILGLRIIPIRRSDGLVIFLIDIPQSENPPHMASDNRYYRRLNFRRVPMEHYEIADLFGKRRKPLLNLIPELKDVKIQDSVYQFNVRLLIANIGKAIARHAQLAISFFNLEIISIKGDFHRIDYLRKNTPSIQYGEHISVFYPTDKRRNAIGDITLIVKNNDKPITIDYDLIAEDMELKENQFRFGIKELEKGKQMIEQGQKPIFIQELI